MKGLLLLFILSPVILFGQVRQRAVVDSIKAASANLQNYTALTDKYPDSKVESVKATDSNGYVTLVVRIHVAEPVAIPAITVRPVIKIRMKELIADKASTIEIPPLDLFILIPDTIAALSPLAVSALNIGATRFARLSTVDLPPLPHVKEEIDVLSVLVAASLKIATSTTSKLDTVDLPPLPHVKEEIDAMSHLAAIQFKIEPFIADKLASVGVPPMPEIESEEGAVPLAAVIKFAVEYPIPNQIGSIPVPVVEEKEDPVADMHLSDEGYLLLQKMEGFSGELYSLKDGGFTIGFGFFVPYGEAGKWSKGVTFAEAERIMRQKVPAYEDQVKRYINVPLTQEEFDALTMLAYNLGGFSKATSIVNDINTNAGFDKLQRDWMKFVHSKAPGVMQGLMNRRKDEMQVRRESNYQSDRKIQILRTRK